MGGGNVNKNIYFGLIQKNWTKSLYIKAVYNIFKLVYSFRYIALSLLVRHGSRFIKTMQGQEVPSESKRRKHLLRPSVVFQIQGECFLRCKDFPSE